MKTLVALACAVVLSGCATSFSQDDVVPYQDILAIAADRPYECARFDAASDTCEALSTFRENRNGTVAIRSQFEMSIFEPAKITIAADLTPTGPKLCSDYSKVAVTVESKMTAGENRDLEALMRQSLRAYGTVCVAYYKRGNGLVAVSEYPDGRVVEGQPVFEIDFFEAPKSLRLFKG